MNYERRLGLVGRLVDSRTMRDICITEVPGGVVVTGLCEVRESEQTVWRTVTVEVTEDEMSGRAKLGGNSTSRWRWPFGN